MPRINDNWVSAEQERLLHERCGLSAMSLAAVTQLFFLPAILLPYFGISVWIHPLVSGVFVLATLTLLLGAIRFVRYFALPWPYVLVALGGVAGLVVFHRIANREHFREADITQRGFEVVQQADKSRHWKMSLRVQLAGSLSNITSEPITLDFARGATTQQAARFLRRVFPQISVSPAQMKFRINGQDARADDELRENDVLEIIGL